MRRVLPLGLCALALFAVPPQTARQGDVLKITASHPAAKARLRDRTVTLFPQPGGQVFGLLPIPVLERPGRYWLELLDTAGAVLDTGPVTVLNARFRRQNITLSKAAAALQPSPGEMETVRAFRETVSPERFWSEPFAAPVPGCLTSPFGVLRMYNGKPTGNFHGGVDQRGPEGEIVRAVAGGTVRLVRMFPIHGGTVGIDHGQGLTSIYLHLSKLLAVEGTPVKRGDPIGAVGSTGRSTAPHLHWALYAHGVAVNPMQWVRVAPCRAAAK